MITFDDLLTRLDHALADDERGPAVARWLRGRYDVALVDEFQDTDLVQWDIMRRAFGSGESTLVLIGDPKQAIYAFRGADVFSYLDAAETATNHATLVTNWRSDQGLIDAYDALFAGSQLGHAGIALSQGDGRCPQRRPPTRRSSGRPTAYQGGGPQGRRARRPRATRSSTRRGT